MNSLFRLTPRTLSYLSKTALHEFDSRINCTTRTILCHNSVLNLTRSFHITPLRLEEEEKKKTKYEGLLERDPTRDRSRKIPVETSIRYLQSQAFRDGYGDDPVWVHYRRNHKGSKPPEKTRKMCIRNDVIVTGNPCPICRDEYLVVNYKNVDLLKQFISPHTGEIIGYEKTGVCQKQHQNLLVAYLQAKDLGLITFDVPFREYDYSEMEATYVIVGGGIAGMSCVEQIAIFDPGAAMILVSASPLIKTVTSVTPLTKMLVEFSVEEKPYNDLSSIYPSLSVIIDTASSINSSNHVLTTANGTKIKYQKLCLCSGASPKVISNRNEFVIGVRDTDSATVLQNKLKTARRIVVVGNGGIATELVHEIQGVDIIWAVKDKHISAAFVDPGAGEFFQHRLLKKDHEEDSTVITTFRCTADSNKSTDKLGAALGPHWHDNIALTNADRNTSNISVEYSVEVKNVFTKDNEENWPVFVQLTNGKTYGCDFIVSATGVIPNSKTITVEDSHFEIADDKGIKVNSKMETNIKDVYAAGDICTASWDPAFHWLQMRLWTQARQMGAYSGKCMADAATGEETIQDFCFELFTHVTRFFGYKVILLGLFNGQKLGTGYEIMLRVTKAKEYIKLVIRDGKLQGAILIGDTDLEEMCENLILDQLDVSHLGEDLLNPDVDVEDYFD